MLAREMPLCADGCLRFTPRVAATQRRVRRAKRGVRASRRRAAYAGNVANYSAKRTQRDARHTFCAEHADISRRFSSFFDGFHVLAPFQFFSDSLPLRHFAAADSCSEPEDAQRYHCDIFYAPPSPRPSLNMPAEGRAMRHPRERQKRCVASRHSSVNA